MEPVTVSEAAAHASRVHIGVCIPLLTLGVLIYLVRMWHRMKPAWRVGAEDYTVTLGVVCRRLAAPSFFRPSPANTSAQQALTVVDFGFTVLRVKLQSGVLSSEAVYAAEKYSFLAIPIWGIAMMFIKCSIALLLLKIQNQALWWRIFCWSMIAIITAYGIGNTFFIMLQCRPLEAAWDPSVLEDGGSCLPGSAIVTASNVGSAVNISTDILLSLAPLAFLWKLRRPLREKLLIGALMGLGTIAAAASIVKAMLVKDYNAVDDSWERLVRINTWTMLEQLIAIIVASAPYLKPLLQRTLQRFGVTITDSGPGVSYGVNYGPGYAANSRRDTFAAGPPGNWTEVPESRDGAANSDEIPLGTRGPNGFTKGDGESRVNVHGGRSSDSSEGRAWN